MKEIYIVKNLLLNKDQVKIYILCTIFKSSTKIQMIITRMFKKQIYIPDSQELKEIIESYCAIKKTN